MPQAAINGTYPHPRLQGASVTAGDTQHLVSWCNRNLARTDQVAVDIETYGLGVDMRRIKCVVLAIDNDAAVIDPRRPDQAGLIREVLADASLQLIVHTATADVPSLYLNGLLSPAALQRVVDIVIYARMAEPGLIPSKKLEHLAQRHLGLPISSRGAAFKAQGMTKTEGYKLMDIDRPAYLFGAAADGIATSRLLPLVHKAALRRTYFDHPFTVGLSELEALDEIEKYQRKNRIWLRRTLAGIRVDLEFSERYREINGRDRAHSESVLRAAGIDPGNGNHLAAVLEKLGAIPPDHPRTKTGLVSTEAKSLELIQHPLARTFVRNKQLAKIEDDYLNKVRDLSIDGRIYPTVSVLAAAHGRDSMADPPLHQFPEEARGILLADDGDEMVGVDWAQQEPVIALNLAGDVAALAGYEMRGQKLYTAISEFAHIKYKVAKIVLLAGLYGEGLAKLSADLGLDPGPYVPKVVDGIAVRDDFGNTVMIATYRAARKVREATFAPIPRTWDMLANLKRMAKQTGLVYTMNGRILPIPMGPGFDGGPPGRQTHKGPNFHISGSATDQMTDTLIELDKRGLAGGVYLGMHDELVVSRHIAREVSGIMRTPPPRLVMLAVRTPIIRTDFAYLGDRWGAVCVHRQDPCSVCQEMFAA